MPGDEELGDKSMEARTCSRELGKPGPRETHKRTGTINNEPFWPPGATEVAMGLLIATGTPVS